MNGSRSLDAPEFLIPKEDDPVDFLLRMGEKANPEYDHYLSTVFHRPAPLATQGTAPVEPMMPLLNVNPTRSLDRPQGLTRADKVLNVLRDGQWHQGHELTGPTVGGSEGLRRLREIKQQLAKAGGTGKIEARRIAGRASWQYRWVR